MVDLPHFNELILLARYGDERATRELMRAYEPYLVLAARAQLRRTRGKLLLTPEDVTAAVFSNFFVRLRRSSFQFQGPEDLEKLFNVMTRNFVLDEWRKERAAKRESQRVEVTDSGSDLLSGAAAPTATPSWIVGGEELVREVRRRLTPEELYLADQHADGRSWSSLAEELGQPADTLRKRLDRSVTRILKDLGLGTQG